MEIEEPLRSAFSAAKSTPSNHIQSSSSVNQPSPATLFSGTLSLLDQNCSDDCPLPEVLMAGTITTVDVRNLLNMYTPSLIHGGALRYIPKDYKAYRFVYALIREMERRRSSIMYGSQGYVVRLIGLITEKEHQLAETRFLIKKAEADLDSANELIEQLDIDISAAVVQIEEPYRSALSAAIPIPSHQQIKNANLQSGAEPGNIDSNYDSCTRDSILLKCEPAIPRNPILRTQSLLILTSRWFYAAGCSFW